MGLAKWFLLLLRNEFTCASFCTAAKEESCTNFHTNPGTGNCESISNGGQGLVKTSSSNPKAIKIWTNENEQLQTG